jgi:ubiquinone/menaquinone biosynthesis C-methylase UbiE
MREIIKLLLPPIFIKAFRKVVPAKSSNDISWNMEEQNKGEYWGNLADLLERWGDDHVWNEIQMFLYDKKGKVLDIACGTGATMQRLSKFPALELYGVDNSKELIDKCKLKGFDEKHLNTQDVLQKLNYADDFFDYSYSIGLLHYIKENELDRFVSELYRITRVASFHKLPMSLHDTDQDEVITWQKYINNSSTWWANELRKKFSRVEVIKSGWKDNDYALSKGVWLVCIK